ncbi:MAG: membrane dipeptidase [Clostridia bacterium]|nr:membrane dipeptidase [Clostridia bacterium]
MRLAYPIFDAHCDSAVKRSLDGEENQFRCSDMLCFPAYLQVFAVCAEGKANAFSFTEETILRLLRSLRKNDITVVKGRQEIFDTQRGAILAIEGADALHGSLAALRHFYRRGVRVLTLTWNNDNDAASSVTAVQDNGLKPFGRRLIRECEALGITVDLSHISDKAFFEAANHSRRRVICSHSNSRTVCPDFKRNITDSQFKTLIKLRGVAGINLCADFCGLGRDMRAVTAHIEHFCALGGEKNIGIGTDFDGVSELPKGCDGARWLHELFEALLRLNYPEKTVRAIAFKNFYELFYENMKKSIA